MRTQVIEREPGDFESCGEETPAIPQGARVLPFVNTPPVMNGPELDREFPPAERAHRLSQLSGIFGDTRVGLVGGGSQSLMDYFNSTCVAGIPGKPRDGLEQVLGSVLRPRVEGQLLSDYGSGSLSSGSSNPRVYLPENLLYVLNECLREDLPQGRPAVELNMGVTIKEFNPTMLAYFMLVLNRYQDLLKTGKELGFESNTLPVRLRIFSTLGFDWVHEAPDDPEQLSMFQTDLKAMAEEQERWLRALIMHLYPDIGGVMPKLELANFPLPDLSVEHVTNRKQVAGIMRNGPQLSEAFETAGAKHGGRHGQFFSQDYAAWHLSRKTFGDGGVDEPFARLSVGGPSENLFDLLREAALRANREAGRPVPLVSAVTVPSRVICKSPPYLKRDGLFKVAGNPLDEISLGEFLDGDSGRVKGLLDDPLGLQHPTRSEWAMVARSFAVQRGITGTAKERDIEGVRAFRHFLTILQGAAIRSK